MPRTYEPRPPETEAERGERHTPNPPDSRTLLSVDGRGRISLGQLAGGVRLYQGRREDDGTIVLTPAVVFTRDAITRAMADGEAAVARLLADVREAG